MKTRETGVSRGFGFVTFEDDAAMQAVLDTLHDLDGREVRGRWSLFVLFLIFFVPHRSGCLQRDVVIQNCKGDTKPDELGR